MKYFKTQELVPESAYKARGEKSISVIDNRIITFLEKLREALGKPITVNNWHVGGSREWSTLRTSDSPWYSQYSQHTYGRAADFLVKGMEAQDVRKWIINNRDLDWIKPITFLEDFEGMNWTHVDVRSGTDGNLWVWNKDSGKTEVYVRR